jgi:hypothetical protein
LKADADRRANEQIGGAVLGVLSVPLAGMETFACSLPFVLCTEKDNDNNLYLVPFYGLSRIHAEARRRSSVVAGSHDLAVPFLELSHRIPTIKKLGFPDVWRSASPSSFALR